MTTLLVPRSAAISQPPAGLLGVVVFDFTFNDPTPWVICTIPGDRRILSVTLIIGTAFDGFEAAIAVGDGDDPEALMPYDGNDPSLPGVYVASSLPLYLLPTDILLTMAPSAGASQGAGTIILEIEPF